MSLEYHLSGFWIHFHSGEEKLTPPNSSKVVLQWILTAGVTLTYYPNIVSAYPLVYTVAI